MRARNEIRMSKLAQLAVFFFPKCGTSATAMLGPGRWATRPANGSASLSGLALLRRSKNPHQSCGTAVETIE